MTEKLVIRPCEEGARDAIRIDMLPQVLRPTDNFTVSGKAAKDRPLLLSWTLNGRLNEEIIETDGDGRFSHVLDFSEAEHMVVSRISVSYADGLLSELGAQTEIQFDSLCTLHADSAVYTDQMTAVSGSADPGASVTLTHKNLSFTQQTDASGAFSFDHLVLTDGYPVILEAEDAAGNTSRLEMPVSVGKIEIRLESISMPQHNRTEFALSDTVVIRATEQLVLSGTAARNQELEVSWTLNGSGKSSRFHADDNGYWNVTLDYSAARHEGMSEIRIGYADGESPEMNARAELSFDNQCLLSLDKPAYTDQMDTISGKTDPGAIVTLTIGREQVLPQRADQNGSFSFEGLTLVGGTSFELTAEDSLGNTEKIRMKIEAAEREVISMKAENARYEQPEGHESCGASLGADASRLTITGKAQPGMTLKITQGIRRYDVTANQKGSFELTIPVSDLVPGEIAFNASYADGFREECSTEFRLYYDNTVPSITVDQMIPGNRIEAVVSVISGITEPGAEVQITHSGAKETVTADAEGRFSVDMPNLKPNKDLVVTAEDAAHNAGEVSFSVVAEIRDARAEIVKLGTANTIQDGNLTVQASMIHKGDIGLYFIIESGGREVARGQFAQKAFRDMKEKDVQEEMQKYDDLIGFYEGTELRCRFDYLEPQPQLSYGSYTFHLCTDDINGTPMRLASADFTNVASEPDTEDEDIGSGAMEVENEYVGDFYGFGLDAMKEGSFPNSQIYLTGWRWREDAGKPESYEFDIDSEHYDAARLKAEGGSMTVTYLPRDLSAEFPRKVETVFPIESDAGIVIEINLPTLKKGDHNITLYVNADGKQIKFAKRKINISTRMEVDETLIETLKTQWK